MGLHSSSFGMVSYEEVRVAGILSALLLFYCYLQARADAIHTELVDLRKLNETHTRELTSLRAALVTVKEIGQAFARVYSQGTIWTAGSKTHVYGNGTAFTDDMKGGFLRVGDTYGVIMSVLRSNALILSIQPHLDCNTPYEIWYGNNRKLPTATHARHHYFTDEYIPSSLPTYFADHFSFYFGVSSAYFIPLDCIIVILGLYMIFRRAWSM